MPVPNTYNTPAQILESKRRYGGLLPGAGRVSPPSRVAGTSTPITNISQLPAGEPSGMNMPASRPIGVARPLPANAAAVGMPGFGAGGNLAPQGTAGPARVLPGPGQGPPTPQVNTLPGHLGQPLNPFQPNASAGLLATIPGQLPATEHAAQAYGRVPKLTVGGNFGQTRGMGHSQTEGQMLANQTMPGYDKWGAGQSAEFGMRGMIHGADGRVHYAGTPAPTDQEKFASEKQAREQASRWVQSHPNTQLTPSGLGIMPKAGSPPSPGLVSAPSPEMAARQSAFQENRAATKASRQAAVQANAQDREYARRVRTGKLGREESLERNVPGYANTNALQRGLNERARMADAGATERARLTDKGATERAGMLDRGQTARNQATIEGAQKRAETQESGATKRAGIVARGQRQSDRARTRSAEKIAAEGNKSREAITKQQGENAKGLVEAQRDPNANMKAGVAAMGNLPPEQREALGPAAGAAVGGLLGVPPGSVPAKPSSPYLRGKLTESHMADIERIKENPQSVRDVLRNKHGMSDSEIAVALQQIYGDGIGGFSSRSADYPEGNLFFGDIVNSRTGKKSVLLTTARNMTGSGSMWPLMLPGGLYEVAKSRLGY